MKPTSNYRLKVGPADLYDLMAAMQFNLLTSIGLREHHYVLDIGCGSLRAGRLLIPYLQPGHYFGIEPQEGLVREGIQKEIGQSTIELKRPTLSSNGEFQLSIFNREFDFLMAQSIFSHANERQITTCFSEAKKVMGPEAIFAASFFSSRENYSGEKWAVRATYTLAHMTELANQAGLQCELFDWPHTDLQTWILLTHPGSKVQLPRLTTTARVVQLEGQVADLLRQMDWMMNHPWIKLGTKAKVFAHPSMPSRVVFKIFFDFKKRQLLRTIRKER